MKIILTNAIFAAIVWGYYLYVAGDKPLFVRGLLFAFVCYASGIWVGVSVATRPRKGTRRSYAAVHDDRFDRIA